MAFTTGTISTFVEFMAVLKSFCCGTKRTILAGTGNGILKNFSGTLANIPVGKGQCRLSFYILGFKFLVWDNGEGSFISSKITTSSLNYTTGEWSIEFANPLDNTTEFNILWCQNTNATEGRDWLILSDVYSKKDTGVDAFPSLSLMETVIKNSGYSYKDFICVGTREFQYPTASFYGLDLNSYLSFDEATDYWSINIATRGAWNYDAITNHWLQNPIVPLNNESMTYWIFSSKQRILGIIKVRPGVYESFYIGHGLRLSSPSHYISPLVCLGSASGNINIFDTSDYHQCILHPYLSGHASFCSYPSGSSTLYTTVSHSVKMIPGHYLSLTNFNQPKLTTNNKLIFSPVYVAIDTPYTFVLQELDGVYTSYTRDYVAEDTVTESAKDYIIFHDIFRTGSDMLVIRKD